MYLKKIHKRSMLTLAIAVAIMITSCERFPKDPANTLQQVQNKTLRVGITENPPYVVFEKGGPSGTEIELIKIIADQLGANIEWVKGPEGTINTLLKEGQIHLCAGGFGSKSVWKKHVYLMRPHDTLTYKWGVPMGNQLPENLEEKKVYVARGSVAGAFVHKQGGYPVYVDSLLGTETLIAAPERQLKELKYQISQEKLKEEKISLAAQKGENAFLERVEKIVADYGKKSGK